MLVVLSGLAKIEREHGGGANLFPFIWKLWKEAKQEEVFFFFFSQ